MRQHRLSYWKTIVLSGVCATISAVGLAIWLIQGWVIVGALALGAILIVSGFVVGGGGICLLLDSQVRASHRDVNAPKTVTD